LLKILPQILFNRFVIL